MTHVQDAEIVTSEPTAPSRLARAWGLAGLALLLGCGSVRQDGPDALPFDAVAPKLDVLRGRAEVADAPIQDVPPADAAAEGGDAATETGPDLLIDPNGEATLLGAPLVFAPTEQGFGISAVLSQGRPRELWLRIRQAGSPTWSPDVAPATPAADIAEWRFAGLQAGQRYEYEILVLGPAVDGGARSLYTGSAVTQRKPGQAFTLGLLTDSHIGSDLSYGNQGDPEVLSTVAAELGAVSPDFMIHLGDMLDFHEHGFNDPVPDGSITRAAYLNYRTLLGDLVGRAAHFAAIGNWEGENGNYTAEEIERSRQQRLLYVPGPRPDTYPESGSPAEDYYAFTWGDALFVVLNVMSYTPTQHLLGADPGLPDDWTLGPDQLAWLSATLANAHAKWRFLFIHHTVGGKAGTDDDSAYGRGGGQAAYVGEQATVHALMLQHGVQVFFYGHDHVFAENVVDGIHYSDVGNAGAPWKFDTSLTGYSQSWLEFGWTKVTVSPEQVDVQFIKMGGEVLYEYTLP